MAPVIINYSDIEALADRLLARGKSRMFGDQPTLQSDMILAAKLLIRWCRRDADQLRCPFDLDD